MKRLWIGLVLLLGLPVLGFGVWAAMDTLHAPISAELETAAEEALAGDWRIAVSTAREARERWEDVHAVTAALCDHRTLDDIDALFARLEAYGRTRDRSAFAAACLELSRLTRVPAEGQRFSWWNLM